MFNSDAADFGHDKGRRSHHAGAVAYTLDFFESRLSVYESLNDLIAMSYLPEKS